MSIYRKVQMFDSASGMAASGRDRFLSTLFGLICYFVAIDLINLVRRPLRRKVHILVQKIKDHKTKSEVNNVSL